MGGKKEKREKRKKKNIAPDGKHSAVKRSNRMNLN